MRSVSIYYREVDPSYQKRQNQYRAGIMEERDSCAGADCSCKMFPCRRTVETLSISLKHQNHGVAAIPLHTAESHFCLPEGENFSWSRPRNTSAALEKTWYFFQTILEPDSNTGFKGRKQSLSRATFFAPRVSAFPMPLSTRSEAL